MREIQVQKLTKDNFGKYGEFLDLLDESELKKKSIFQEGFFADRFLFCSLARCKYAYR